MQDNEGKSQEQQKQPKDILITALKEQIFSKTDKTDDEKAAMAYSLIVGALSQFMAHTKLQLRLLNESRALEHALGDKMSWFDVAIVANPVGRRPKLDTTEEVKAEPTAETKSEESSNVAVEPQSSQNQG